MSRNNPWENGGAQNQDGVSGAAELAKFPWAGENPTKSNQIRLNPTKSKLIQPKKRCGVKKVKRVADWLIVEGWRLMAAGQEVAG